MIPTAMVIFFLTFWVFGNVQYPISTTYTKWANTRIFMLLNRTFLFEALYICQKAKTSNLIEISFEKGLNRFGSLSNFIFSAIMPHCVYGDVMDKTMIQLVCGQTQEDEFELSYEEFPSLK